MTPTQPDEKAQEIVACPCCNFKPLVQHLAAKYGIGNREKIVELWNSEIDIWNRRCPTDQKLREVVGKMRNLLYEFTGISNEYDDMIFKAQAQADEILGGEQSCKTCNGTGAVDAPFSGSDPSCPDCDGERKAND